MSPELEGDHERPLRLGGVLLGGVRRRGDLLDEARLGGDLLGGDRLRGDLLGGDRWGDLIVDLLV